MWAILWRHRATGEVHMDLQSQFDALDTKDFEVVGRKRIGIKVGEFDWDSVL